MFAILGIIAAVLAHGFGAVSAVEWICLAIGTIGSIVAYNTP
jgi:hypothetical protein